MEIISDDSIELEEIPSGPGSEQIARKSYRLPVRNKEQFYLKVDGNCFPLVDISDGGICIAVEADTDFPHDAILRGCQLTLGEQSFDNLEGEIAHISVDDEGNWISGIQWTMIDESIRPELEEKLVVLRKEFFNNA